MPLYSVKDLETSEIKEVNMQYEEFKKYLLENKNMIQVFTKFPGLGDSVRLGIRKPDDGFRDVLRNVGDHHKRNDINTF